MIFGLRSVSKAVLGDLLSLVLRRHRDKLNATTENTTLFKRLLLRQILNGCLMKALVVLLSFQQKVKK
jgi:hypothetical protein